MNVAELEMDPLVLPKHSDLSPHQVGFLDQHFETLRDLPASSHLFTSLNNSCSDLDTHFFSLETHLSKHAVSWISRSFPAKTALHKLNLKLASIQYLMQLHQCSFDLVYWVLSKLSVSPDTTLELETLVGDLEDEVFFAVNHPNGNIFSAKRSNSSITADFQPKNERLVQALKVLNGIEEVLVRVAKIQPQWHHLLKSVDIRVDKLLAVLRPQVFADHRNLLASIGWPPKLVTSESGSADTHGIPNPLVSVQGSQRECYCQSALALCALQHLQTRKEKRQLNLFGQERDAGIWVIDELVSPFASRIEYHFLRWVEQPEYIFALLYKITRDLILGVDDVLGPLIDKARLRTYGAKAAWVSAMVQMLSKFLAKSIFPSLCERYKEKHERAEVMSSWLHLIDHIIAFDRKMQSLLSLENYFFLKDTDMFEGLSRSISVLMLFSDQPKWLNVWAKIELKNAWRKLKAELKDERAWLIDNIGNFDLHIEKESEQFLLSTREHHKSPLIAESAIRFSWEMIERCQTFPAVLPRIQFIRSTAAKFLWHFLNVLLFQCKGIESYLDNPDDEILMTICGSINAARYVESKLREWSEDVNFLEMTAAENDSNIYRKNHVTYDNSCFFWEEIKSLLELETNWLMEIVAALLRQFETLSWEYIQNKDRFEQEQEQEEFFETLSWEYIQDKDHFEGEQEEFTKERDSVASIDFVESLDALRRQLSACNMGLNPKDFIDLWRSVADGLDHFIFCSIFTNKIQFSSNGMNLFEADMEALFLVFKPFCGRPEAFFPCIRETLSVLKISEGELKQLQVALCNDKNRSKYLHSLGISHLSFDQIDKILSSRKL
ncbi:hypothetical protein Pint_31579 [Pistacia integerrima]|uniref:Uncharacterized protein n=1 Tax=Pistacia integerrima TaxID=434235 RepID=A0ACC0XNY8_9ROSI|nr:hypothetical protein Pint_31579 [Pistacia integerrima]